MRGKPGSDDCRQQGAQKGLEPSDEPAEVVAGGGQDGIGAVERWRQRVSEERSKGSEWQKLSFPQKYW